MISVGLQLEVARTAIAEMYREGRFSICTIDRLLKLTARSRHRAFMKRWRVCTACIFATCRRGCGWSCRG